MSSVDALIQALCQGPLAATEIGRRLGLSQPTVSRLVAKAGEAVLRLGKGKATRYAALRVVPGVGSRVPVYAVEADGAVRALGTLLPLAADQFLFVGNECPAVYLGDNGGLFDGLPYFLADLRPQGFMGRAMASALAQVEGYPEDPNRWSADQVLHYLIHYGEELLGHLLVGERALNRYMKAEPAPRMDRPVDFPRAAAHALSGEPVGSSAGGEQPKFTGVTDLGAVLVKFSPEGELFPASLRWQDLLFAEHHALQTLGENGIPSAATMVWKFDGRVFLEVCRFDRSPKGRASLVSLSMVDAEFSGIGSHWVRTVEALVKRGVMERDDAERAIFAHTFGEWIGNTDMHLGNLSLRPVGNRFGLLPIYDMLPMRLIPRYNEVRQYTPMTPPDVTENNRAVWSDAGRLALVFWEEVARDLRISETFRTLAQQESAAIAEALRRAPRLIA